MNTSTQETTNGTNGGASVAKVERDYTKEVSSFMVPFEVREKLPTGTIELVCLRARASFLAAELEAVADIEYAAALIGSEAKNEGARKAEADMASAVNRRRVANLRACIAGYTALLPQEHRS